MLTFMPTSIVILALLAILLVIILLKTAKVVPNQQAYVVERLGKFRTVLYAGFHLLIPFLDVVAYKRSLKEQVLDVPKQTCITRDNVSVDIDGVLSSGHSPGKIGLRNQRLPFRGGATGADGIALGHRKA